MTKVRIVGGGLSGVLAAFEAHRLGCRDIELYEQFDRLGGTLSPRVAGGLELRTRGFEFGPAKDPVRQLLEWQGVGFDEFESRRGSVSPGQDGRPLSTRGVAGPALPARRLGLAEPAGPSLADRLRAYPADMQQALTRHCQWSLGAWLDEVHASAATALGVDRIYPVGGDASTLAELKLADALYDEFYATPREPGPVAATPHGGFAAMFEICRRRLASLGVAIHAGALASPREMLAARDGAVVWACDPMPLFKAAGLKTPKLINKSVVAYVFKATYAGPTPFQLQNFTAAGVVSRLRVYESRGETLLTCECVAEAPDADLRREIHGLMAGFGGDALTIGEQLEASITPRFFPSVAAAKSFAALRAQLARSPGARFMPAVWEACSPADRLRRIAAGLTDALAEGGDAATAVAA